MEHKVVYSKPEADTTFTTSRWGVVERAIPVHRIRCSCGWTDKSEKRERVEVSFMAHRRIANGG